MSRASDLAIIVRALDRAALASIPVDSDEQHSNGDEILVVAGWILDPGWGERFWYRSKKWTPARVRGAVLGYAQHAPDDELREMARMARGQIAWCEDWDTRERFTSQGWIPLPWHDELAAGSDPAAEG